MNVSRSGMQNRKRMVVMKPSTPMTIALVMIPQPAITQLVGEKVEDIMTKKEGRQGFGQGGNTRFACFVPSKHTGQKQGGRWGL
jgi:hypothetical protein